MYNRIKALCDKEHITIAQLEKEVGLGNGVIGKWRTSMPRADVLLTVAKKFGVTVEYLIKGEEAIEQKEEVS